MLSCNQLYIHRWITGEAAVGWDVNGNIYYDTDHKITYLHALGDTFDIDDDMPCFYGSNTTGTETCNIDIPGIRGILFGTVVKAMLRVNYYIVIKDSSGTTLTSMAAKAQVKAEMPNNNWIPQHLSTSFTPGQQWTNADLNYLYW